MNNNKGRVWILVNDRGLEYLEVWRTDEMGRCVRLEASCIVNPGENFDEAVALCIEEMRDPMATDKPDADQLDAMLWLAEVFEANPKWR